MSQLSSTSSEPASIKIMSWNINGLRAAFQTERSNYKNLREMITFLGNPDILCLQEVKNSLDVLGADQILAEGYCTFASFSKRGGYSGVLTAVREGVNITPTFVEEGFTSMKTKSSPIPSFPRHLCELDNRSLMKLDQEGRVLISDHGDFVLFNVYFPASCGSSETHDSYVGDFKADFHNELQRRWNEIRKTRNVIVVGDFNACADVKDRADLIAFNKPTDIKEFEDRKSTKWLRSVYEEGMLDTYRFIYPKDGEKEVKYTNWSTLTGARNTGYGTRLDLVICNNEIKHHVLNAGIEEDIKGSDHCPVWTSFKSFPSSSPPVFTCPPNALRNHIKFSKKQTSIKSFLVKEDPSTSILMIESESIENEDEIEIEIENKTWNCEKCTLENDPFSKFCDACQNKRPISKLSINNNDNNNNKSLKRKLEGMKGDHSKKAKKDQQLKLDFKRKDEKKEDEMEEKKEYKMEEKKKEIKDDHKEEKKVKAKSAWGALGLGEKPSAPSCECKEEAKREQVKDSSKQNFGSKNAGLKEKGGRCNFFLWESDYKKNIQKGK